MDLPKNIIGLTSAEVKESQLRFGNNKVQILKDRVFRHVVKEVVLEPMFILLLIACFIYFFAAAYQEGFIMLVSVFIVAGISFFQEYRSRNAIRALEKLSASKAHVLRNGKPVQIETADIVMGDILLLEEGEVVTADGLIVSANDFSLNESVLTGESFTVNKAAENNNHVYKGTLVTSGNAAIEVNAIGNKTMFGKIGLSLQEITVLKTPLQIQIRSFVRYMVWIGGIAFLLVIGYNYYHSENLLQSFLQGLTLAMSLLPEEIPVAFSTFQALGAFRLLKNNVIVKQPQYVETLGSATVICTDKTGTLTQNKMVIEYLYDAINNKSVHRDDKSNLPPELIEYAMWASETNPFDPMEKSIYSLYGQSAVLDKRVQYKQIHEYPVAGKPPMMTHIFRNEKGEQVIAAKGAPEAILRLSQLSETAKRHLEEQSILYAKKGYRVLGVGKAEWTEKQFPDSQQEFVFDFLGLLAFHDPPKENISETIKIFNDAGIQVKMITGDFAETALAIAGQIQLSHNNEVLTGTDIMNMSDELLMRKVEQVNIYARMYPEAKLKVIEALKANGEIVAMTGDGVNDAPALKASHIGIAMGMRGSEVAKSTASLILVDDDLGHMTVAIANGRKIYDNLKKAIQYIVSIHIPIILIVTLPLLLMWKFTDIFSPVHVIFLELIMGPTCSIIYENEPMEPGTMLRPPRKISSTFLSSKQLMISVVQGLMITVGCLGIGYYYLSRQNDETFVRTVIFISLLFSNIFLTLVNRSFRISFLSTLKYKNKLLPLIIALTLICISLFLFVPFVQDLFRLSDLSVYEIFLCIAAAIISTFWIEIWKKIRNS